MKYKTFVKSLKCDIVCYVRDRVCNKRNKNIFNNLQTAFKKGYKINISINEFLSTTEFLLNNEKERNKIISNVYNNEVTDYVVQKQLQGLLS